MTEWYYGNDGDLVVQRDQEFFDRLSSPDSWAQWETRGIGGNSGWPNTFDSGNFANAKPQHQTLFGRTGNKESNGHDSSNFKGSSEDPHFLRRTSAACARSDYYFNDLAETDSADDIFLSSLLEDDVLPLQSLYIGMPSESGSTNKMMAFESISCDTDGEGNLKCFTNPNFPSSQSSDSGRSRCPSVEVPETRDRVPSNHEAQMTTRTLEANDLSSIEASVLMGLESILNQLSDETRICLRDSMYRLAESSEQQTSNNAMEDEPSLPETSDECSRSETMEMPESETNVIDRAVAYMMFNKVNGNEQDYILALSPEFVHNETLLQQETLNLLIY